MSRTTVVIIGALLTASVAAAQSGAGDPLAGRWTGDVSCLHGGGDTVAITLTRDARGRFTGSTDWGLARSDGRKGPELPFVQLTAGSRSIVAQGQVGSRQATLRAALQDGALHGSWRVAGVDDEWTFVARKAGGASPAPR